MSVLQPNERNLEDLGGANANSTPSSGQGQSLEANLPALTAQLNQVLKKLDAQEGEIRALKSGKDKAVDRALGEITPLKETLARIAKHLNIGEDEVLRAQREMVLDDLVAGKITAAQSAPASGGTSAIVDNQAELNNIDDLLDLPKNDPRVVNLRLLYANDVAAYRAQAKLLKQSFNQQTPTPAELPSNMQAVQQTRQPTSTALQNEYEQKRDGIVKSGVGYEERIRLLTDLKMEYAGKGLPLF